MRYCNNGSHLAKHPLIASESWDPTNTAPVLFDVMTHTAEGYAFHLSAPATFLIIVKKKWCRRSWNSWPQEV